jgi:serine/threonine protein phosphatase PrpC
LTRDHKSGKGLLQDEKVRIVKTGFQIRDNKIFHYMQHEVDSPEEIVHGGPLTRCIGDYRFKSNQKLNFDKQAVISLPDVKSINEWAKWDYILIGSSGFWDICKF